MKRLFGKRELGFCCWRIFCVGVNYGDGGDGYWCLEIDGGFIISVIVEKKLFFVIAIKCMIIFCYYGDFFIVIVAVVIIKVIFIV